MQQTSRPGFQHRRLRIILVALLLVTSSLSTALARQATPAPDDETRLYISHGGGFIARIPAAWDPDRSLDDDYAGRDGFVATVTTASLDASQASHDAACAAVAAMGRFGGAGMVTRITWRDRPACEIRVVGEQQDDPAALVFQRDTPGPAEETLWVVVIVDAGHFDAVTASISFDTSGVTTAMFLDSVLDIIEARSLWRDAVDWDALREQAHARLGGFADMQTFWVAEPAIRIVIDALHTAGADWHTLLIPSARVDTVVDMVSVYEPPRGGSLPHGIGYLTVPGFGGVPEDGARYVTVLHDHIEDQARGATCGWIVDLRGNTGGNPIPMLEAIAPLLPTGNVLTIRTVDGEEDAWDLTTSGASGVGSDLTPWPPRATTVADPVLMRQPVAVLIGPESASAAESVAIAFVDRDRTAFFGEPTAGVASEPYWIQLLDGSLMAVTTGWMVGPQGAIYPDGIAPDVTVSPSAPTTGAPERDRVVQEASDWLRQQPGCDQAATPAT